MRIAHLIHPAAVSPDRDLFKAQPITFASMVAAAAFARDHGAAGVELLAVQMAGEEELSLPPEFRRLPPLQRSVDDYQPVQEPRRLALAADLFEALGRGAGAAEWGIYTNVDIGVQPHFYSTVAALIAQGFDAFAINRRTISAGFESAADLPLMYAEPGAPHPGWDCFVFPVALIARFRLGAVCVGAAGFGRSVLANLAVLGKRFHVFEDLHATFHLGNEQIWKEERFQDYARHNHQECLRILESFESSRGTSSPESWLGRLLRQARHAVGSRGG
ncbi:MAG: hypothetical protein V1750_04290 [Acidobacteriota bacterium]